MEQFRDITARQRAREAASIFKTGLCSGNAAERVQIANLLDLDTRRQAASAAAGRFPAARTSRR